MLTGNYRELEDLRRRMQLIANGGMQRLVSEACAAAAVQEIETGFSRGVTPYDEPWEPLKYRSGEPLRDERKLEGALTRRPIVTQHGFVITTRGASGADSVRFAGTHQYGKTISARRARYMRFRVGGTTRANGPTVVRAQKVRIPRRQMMPEGTLGRRWARAFERATDRVLWTTLFGGGTVR